MSKPEDRLRRLFDTPVLARVVPHLAPETLHQLIRSHGLAASGELVAAATPAQLTSVLDLDLWPSTRPGRDERFDEDRFGEWLELFVDTGDDLAARTLASIDENLVVAGLSRYVRVFDPGTFEPTVSREDRSLDAEETPFGGFECEVGGYLVRARRTDAWDAVVRLLVALDTHEPDCFHAVMRGCRRLSSSEPEIDGLDDLLMAPAQQFHEIALERERRRSLQGYTTPADARAFLHMARQRHLDPPHAASINPLAAAYFRAADEAVVAADRHGGSAQRALQPLEGATRSALPESASIDAVVDLLTEAGLVPERPRALLQGASGQPSRLTRIRLLMAHIHDADPAAYGRRSQELAFLTNTLVAGCSVQSRAFTVQEASDAAVGVCNLGLEQWPATVPDTYLADHDLVTAFETGWAVLHRDVSLFVAERLILTLTNLRCVDAGIQRGLHALRRELVRQRDAGTPWRVGDALDVLAMLDAPAWIGVLGLLDECPMLPAAVTAILEGRTGAVSTSAFEFISTTGQLQNVRAFMDRLLDVLTGASPSESRSSGI